ncbi:MAG: hypothetical protein EPO02_13670 [Nitrospirae bacterium]|nr:MAG: hypothetical protein EPO02_13670 [Nitrospirota bacterium]
MKILIRFSTIIMLFLCLSISYAQENIDNRFMDENDEMEYEQNIVQASSPETETHEQSVYDVDMRPYVAFKYTSNKTKIERK